MIVAESLTKTFGATTALRAVSFTVAPGEVLGFLGPNGAGKTTALRILAGVFPPSTGRASIAGHDLARDPLAARRRLGYAPERPALHTDMTVRAQLLFAAALRRVDHPEQATTAVLAQLNLETLAHARIGTLSKGIRQRVTLALALVGDPPALLLDEPLAGLDPAQSAETRALIRALGRERAVLVSSHHLAEVEMTCDRVVILHHGQVLAAGPPAELAERLRPAARVDVEAATDPDRLAAALGKVSGVTHVDVLRTGDGHGTCRAHVAEGTDVRAALAACVLAHGWDLLGLTTVEPSLEEAFLALTR